MGLFSASPRPLHHCQVDNAGHGHGVWFALERGNQGQHGPRWAPRVRQGAMLTTRLVQTLLGHQLSSRWTPVHKPSSNSRLAVASITAPATDASPANNSISCKQKCLSHTYWVQFVIPEGYPTVLLACSRH